MFLSCNYRCTYIIGYMPFLSHIHTGNRYCSSIKMYELTKSQRIVLSAVLYIDQYLDNLVLKRTCVTRNIINLNSYISFSKFKLCRIFQLFFIRNVFGAKETNDFFIFSAYELRLLITILLLRTHYKTNIFIAFHLRINYKIMKRSLAVINKVSALMG